MDVVLEQVHQIDVTVDESTKNILVPHIGVKIPRQEDLKDIRVYKMCDVVHITATSVDLEFATKGWCSDVGTEENGKKKKFKTV